VCYYRIEDTQEEVLPLGHDFMLKITAFEGNPEGFDTFHPPAINHLVGKGYTLVGIKSKQFLAGDTPVKGV